MNSLSWMIYFAGMTGSVGGVFVTAAAVSGIAAAVLFLWSGILHSSSPIIWSWEDKATKIENHNSTARAAKKYGFLCLKVCVPAAFIAALIPSSGTVYAIAASQTGERVLKSQTGDKAMRALDAWLDKQIAGEPEAKK